MKLLKFAVGVRITEIGLAKVKGHALAIGKGGSRGKPIGCGKILVGYTEVRTITKEIHLLVIHVNSTAYDITYRQTGWRER